MLELGVQQIGSSCLFYYMTLFVKPPGQSVGETRRNKVRLSVETQRVERLDVVITRVLPRNGGMAVDHEVPYR